MARKQSERGVSRRRHLSVTASSLGKDSPGSCAVRSPQQVYLGLISFVALAFAAVGLFLTIGAFAIGAGAGAGHLAAPGIKTLANAMPEAAAQARSRVEPATTGEQFFQLLLNVRSSDFAALTQIVRNGQVNVVSNVSYAGAALPLLQATTELYHSAHATQSYAGGMDDLIVALCNAGANPNQQVAGSHPLLWKAVEMLHLPLVHALLDCGASVSLPHGSMLPSLSYTLTMATGIIQEHLVVLIGAIQAGVAIDVGQLRQKRDAVHSTAPERLRTWYLSSRSFQAILSGTQATASHFTHAQLRDVQMDIFQVLFQKLMQSPNYDIADFAATTSSGQNAFHLMAQNGLSRSAEIVVDAVVLKGRQVATRILSALQVEDILGRTPFHYAALKFGTESTATTSMFHSLLLLARRLTVAAGLEWHNKDEFVSQLRHDAFGYYILDYTRSSKQVSTEEEEALTNATQTTRLNLNVATSDARNADGGWRLDNTLKTLGSDLKPTVCDITSLDAPVSKDDFLSHALTSRPLLLRGEAIGYKLRKNLTKDRFLHNHGSRQMAVGAIPYASNFMMKEDKVTVRNFAEHFLNLSQEGRKVPYSFGKDFLRENPELRNEFEAVPKLLEGLTVAGRHLLVRETQFYLGPPGSGAPMHYHNSAVNVLAYGQKRWFLYPPSRARYSTKPVLDWYQTEYVRGDTHECVQEAGDILFVPALWSHAILNLETSIGVAYEFNF